MLVPKPDSDGEWRFVTDFTQLNNYIRKRPAVSPSIEETKLQIASFKYIACIDLREAIKKKNYETSQIVKKGEGASSPIQTFFRKKFATGGGSRDQ